MLGLVDIDGLTRLGGHPASKMQRVPPVGSRKVVKLSLELLTSGAPFPHAVPSVDVHSFFFTFFCISLNCLLNQSFSKRRHGSQVQGRGCRCGSKSPPSCSVRV